MLGRAATPLGSHPGRQGHPVVQQVAKRPGVVRQSRRHGRRPLQPLASAPGRRLQAETGVGPADVVARADQPHARVQRGHRVGDRATAADQGCQMAAESRVEPLDLGGVDARPGRGRVQHGPDRRGRPAHDPLAGAHHPALGGAFDQLPDQQVGRDLQARAAGAPGADGVPEHSEEGRAVGRWPSHPRTRGRGCRARWRRHGHV